MLLFRNLQAFESAAIAAAWIVLFVGVPLAALLVARARRRPRARPPRERR